MKSILLPIAFLLFFSSLKGQSNLHRLDSLLKEYKELGYHAVVIAGNRDSIQYRKAIGYKNISSRQPMQLNTSFKIESAGKMFTATRVMQLVAQNKIALHKDINHYLPELNIPNGDRITVHHLLNHTSGLASHWETAQFDPQKIYTLKELVAATPVRFNVPGERSYYSNTAYFILAGLIEKIDGIPFHESINKYIFKPAGMNHTGPLSENRLPADAALPYYQITTQEYAEDTTKYIASTQLGAGGWISTAEDLFKFLRAYLTEKLLDQNIIHTQLTADGSKQDTASGFRYGVMRLPGTKDLPSIFGHNGGGRGFSVDAFFEKQSGTIVVMCSNLYGVGYGITRNIFFALLKDSLATQVAPPAHIALGTIIRKKGTSYLLEQKEKIFEEISVMPTERLLINTAENFMQINDHTTARDILTLTRSMFPNSDNAFLVSGRVAMALQDKSSAKELLQQALVLAEKNNNQYVIDEAKKLMN